MTRRILEPSTTRQTPTSFTAGLLIVLGFFTMTPQTAVVIFGLFPLLVGIYILFVWWRLQTWPVTRGKVKGSRLEKLLGTKHGGGQGMGMTTTFKPYVRYEYEVDGKTYSSKNIKIGMVLSGKYVEKYVHRYPVHSEVNVHYNPAKPKQCYLETDLGAGAWLNLGIGISFISLYFYV